MVNPFFEHCNIGSVLAPITGAVFNSCAIGPNSKLSDAADYCNFIGCVLNSCYYNTFRFEYISCSIINCKNKYEGSSYSDYITQWYNYSGSYVSDLDGTTIGIYGGQHPYSLWPEVPGVTKYNLSIDAATKTMTVKLTVDKLAK